jgi:hypothetical protein
VTNSTFHGNILVAGNGGNGGAGASDLFDRDGGDGGDGGGALGSGICNLVGASATILNSTFSSNSATGGAAGVAGTGGGPTGRPGDNGDSGISIAGICNVEGNITIQNTLLARGSSGANGTGNITDLGHNLSSDASVNLTASGSQNNVDPRLGPLANNGGPTFTVALQAGSPAIGSANAAACPPIDQRGFPRQPPCDMGAFESGSETASVSLGIDLVNANTVVLSWLTNAAGYALQSTPGFSSPSWQGVTNSPTTAGSKYQVTNTTTGGDRFYRLRK